MSQKPPPGYIQKPPQAPAAPNRKPSQINVAAMRRGAMDRRAGLVPACSDTSYIMAYCAEAERQTRAECEAEALPPSLRRLFNHMLETHGLAMTSTELYDIRAAATATA